MRILKICVYCKTEFIARKTTTKTCSDDCAKRLYKLNQRNKNIKQVELKEETKRQPQGYITEGERRTIQAKSFLTIAAGALAVGKAFHSTLLT